MTVRYFSRSYCVISHAFDFTKASSQTYEKPNPHDTFPVQDPTLFVTIMLSLLFAKPEDLGYDSALKRRRYPKDGGKICYIYKLANRSTEPSNP